jgi:hypothetical protein
MRIDGSFRPSPLAVASVCPAAYFEAGNGIEGEKWGRVQWKRSLTNPSDAPAVWDATG